MLKTIAFVLVAATATAGVATAGPRKPRPAAAKAPTATTILASVQKAHAGIAHLRTTFHQEVVNVTFGVTTASDGGLLLARPAKMRWDYLADQRKKPSLRTAKSFISDGTTLYVVDNDNQQVIKQDLTHNLLPTAIAFLYGKGDLTAEFRAVLDRSGTYGAATDQVLVLTPRARSAQYKRLYLVVDPVTSRVSQSIVIDAAGNTNHFTFDALDTTSPIADTLFEFSPAAVPTYRVIDASVP